jgi:hypothetical protein
MDCTSITIVNAVSNLVLPTALLLRTILARKVVVFITRSLMEVNRVTDEAMYCIKLSRKK